MPALLTDLYELTMVAAHHRAGRTEIPASFSLFVRSLPARRGYLVAAGLDDALGVLEAMAFSGDDLDALATTGLFDGEFLDWLGALRFTGSVRAVPEGRVVLAGEPLLEVDAPLAEAQLAETALLLHLGHQVTVATKAARLRDAAGSVPVSDFGTRAAAGPDAAMRLARCARIAGLSSTSNVAGSLAYELPASGTMSHSFIQSFPTELEAFETYARQYRERTILLIDTYDSDAGLAAAITVARAMAAQGVRLAGVRIDSGDLADVTRRTRSALDDAGFPDMEVFLTGGLDEDRIRDLLVAGVPVGGFGVGSSLAVPRDAPAVDTTYKLVEIDGRPVRKQSPGKANWPGRKQVWRSATGDTLGLAHESGPAGSEPLLVPVMSGGRRLPGDATDLDASAARFDVDRAWLPEAARRVAEPVPPPVRPSAALVELTARMAPPESG
ncbi:MAG TPA: nicotinate phosphoribosyltransferase [Acidimicrobiales bacterium]|nr:nicotinate phosphoribosyltransferase [Acidimicrobiales bacterium]